MILRSALVLFLFWSLCLFDTDEATDQIFPIQIKHEETFQTILTLSTAEEKAVFGHYLLELSADANEVNRSVIIEKIRKPLQAYQIDEFGLNSLVDSIVPQYQQFILKGKSNSDLVKFPPDIDTIAIDLGFSTYFEAQHSTYGDSINSVKSHIDAMKCLGGNRLRKQSPYVTLVSGFWELSHNKYDTDIKGVDENTIEKKSHYHDWFPFALNVSMPMIFFTSEELMPIMAQYRKHLPTLLVKREYEDLLTKDTYPKNWTHPRHIPNHQLAVVWLEKINLLNQALQLTTSRYLAWYDAALSTYRHRSPPQWGWIDDIVLSLPTNRISYCHVLEFYHEFSGGVYIVHRETVKLLTNLFYKEFTNCYHKYMDHKEAEEYAWKCGSEQHLLTLLAQKYPSLFHKMCYDYGDIDFLYGQSTDPTHPWYNTERT